jgi:hypothetical protein
MSAVVVPVPVQEVTAAVEYFCTAFQARNVANPTVCAEAVRFALDVVKAKAKGLPRETIVGSRRPECEE